jgi:hypothetical protein
MERRETSASMVYQDYREIRDLQDCQVLKDCLDNQE